MKGGGHVLGRGCHASQQGSRGWVAQSWKQRTGALWGLITLLMEVLASLILYAVLFARRPRLLNVRPLAGGRLMFLGVAVALGVGLAMVLAVATLPIPGSRNREEL